MKQVRIIGKLVVIFLLVIICGGRASFAGARGKLYVVGMGPAKADLTAPRVLEIIAKADAIFCSPRVPQRFGEKYVDPSKVAFNPWENVHGEKASKLRKTNKEQWLKNVEKQRKKVQDFIREKLDQGKNVAMLDGGDPCIYGPSLNILLKGFDDKDMEVHPGIGAFNAASAALKRSMTCEGNKLVVLTSTRELLGENMEQEELLRDLSRYQVTMGLYMSLKSLPRLVKKMKKYYPDDLPVAVVFYAGYPEKELVVKSTLDKIVAAIKGEKEGWLGLVMIGKCIE